MDKWLWAARFFRTRSLATRAVLGGRVLVNGTRAKPSRALKLADRIEFSRGEERLELLVRGFSAQRRPAAEAAGLYELVGVRGKRVEGDSIPGQTQPRPERGGRPSKRDRRKLQRLRGR